MHMLIFGAFLAAYLAFFVISSWLQKRMLRQSLANQGFLAKQPLLLLSYVTMFGLIYLLSRMWSWRIVLAFLAASELATILSVIARGWLATDDEVMAFEFFGQSFENFASNRGASLAMMLINLLIGLVFPVVAGVIYFRHAGAPDLPLLAVRYTVLFFLLIGYPTMILIIVGVLSSPNISEETRKVVFIEQLFGLVPSLLILSLAVWAFGGANGAPNLPLYPSPRLALTLAAAYLVTTLLPYAIGARKARRQSLDIMRRQKDLLVKLGDTLELPAADLFAPRLERLLHEVEDTRSTFQRRKHLGELDAAADEAKAFMEEPSIEAYNQFRLKEPRRSYLAWLQDLSQEIAEIERQLPTAASDDERKRNARIWASQFRRKVADLDKSLQETISAKPAFQWASVGAMLIAVLTAVLSKAAEWAWQTYSPHLLK